MNDKRFRLTDNGALFDVDSDKFILGGDELCDLLNSMNNENIILKLRIRQLEHFCYSESGISDYWNYWEKKIEKYYESIK